MKNKILTISIIFILLSCFFIHISFASESVITTTLPSINHLLGDNDKFMILQSPLNNKIILLIYNGDFLYTGHYKYVFNNGSIDDLSSYDYVEDTYNCSISNGSLLKFLYLSNNSWVSYPDYPQNYTASSIGFTFSILDNTLATNFDLHNSNVVFGNDKLVFRKAPILSTLKGMNFRTVMGVFQTMMNGIIPYLIALVFGLVAFWKAWSILSRTLRRA